MENTKTIAPRHIVELAESKRDFSALKDAALIATAEKLEKLNVAEGNVNVRRAMLLLEAKRNTNGLDAAGYNNVSEFASEWFNIGGSMASQLASVAERFYDVDELHPVASWFEPSSLYYLKDFDDVELNQLIADEKLSPITTQAQLKAIKAAQTAEKRKDKKAPTYHFIVTECALNRKGASAVVHEFDGTMEDFKLAFATTAKVDGAAWSKAAPVYEGQLAMLAIKAGSAKDVPTMFYVDYVRKAESKGKSKGKADKAAEKAEKIRKLCERFDISPEEAESLLG